MIALALLPSIVMVAAALIVAIRRRDRKMAGLFLLGLIALLTTAIAVS